MTNKNLTRRSFLKTTTTGATAGSVGLLAVPRVIRAANLNQRIRLGFLGTGGRANAHVGTVLRMQQAGQPVEAAAVCDVYNVHRDRTAKRIQMAAGNAPSKTGDYRDVLGDSNIDAVCIATPDHWHAKMTIEALQAGKHVYCEKPMTHTVGESQDVVAAWAKTGKVMQVGVQRTSDGRWKAANQFIREGHVGKVVQAQTEYHRNSNVGQWRYYRLTREMNPKNIDWKMFLGSEFGLAPQMPFDRALFAQWRCYWPFGCGPFDLFVHRITQMILALGVRYPRRVVAGGGIFLEYDGRQVPDTVTLVADYEAGLQLLVTASMLNARPQEHCIRGHHGTLTFDLITDGFDFQPERSVVTRTYEPEPKHVEVPRPDDETQSHWQNFLEAIEKGDPQACNNPPDLGAAAVVTAMLGAESYRQGQVYEWDAQNGKQIASGPGYARFWEEMSTNKSPPRQIPGWDPYNKDETFSRQLPRDSQQLEGPWPDDDSDPA